MRLGPTRIIHLGSEIDKNWWKSLLRAKKCQIKHSLSEGTCEKLLNWFTFEYTNPDWGSDLM